MASIQARHVKKCPLAPWSTFKQAADGDCKCPRGPAYYVVVRQTGEKKAAGRNRRVAERLLAAVEGQLVEGTYQPVKRGKAFDRFGDEWLDGLEVAERTFESYKAHIAKAKRFFKQTPVDRIDYAQLKRYLQWLRKLGLGDTTCHHHLTTLSNALGSAKKRKYIAKNPFDDFEQGDWPERNDTERAYFRNDEIDRLFKALDYGLYYVLFALALMTGMRMGELRALTWARVDLEAGQIIVRKNRPSGARTTKRPKSGRFRKIELLPEAQALLRAWWKFNGCPSGRTLVFIGLHKHSFVAPAAIRTNLEQAMRAALVSKADPDEPQVDRTFHSFRHTFAKRALERGTGLEWLSRALGHSSTSFTEKQYGHWEPGEIQRIGARLIGGFGALSSRWASDERQGRVVIRKTRRGRFSFAVEDADGKLIATSPDFDTKRRCLQAADAMRTIALGTPTPDAA
jgi:integrase